MWKEKLLHPLFLFLRVVQSKIKGAKKQQNSTVRKTEKGDKRVGRQTIAKHKKKYGGVYESRHRNLYVPVAPTLQHTPTPIKIHYHSLSHSLSLSLPRTLILTNFFHFLKSFSSVETKLISSPLLLYNHSSSPGPKHPTLLTGMQPPSPTTIATTANTHVRLKSSANDFIVRELSPNQE